MKIKVISCFAVVCVIITALIAIMLRCYFFPMKYKEEVLTYSNKYNLDPYLVFAIINAESRFNKDATSQKNAKGLMQITLPTAREINETTNSTDSLDENTIYNEEVNIEIGCKYLASLIENYNGNYYLAICAYNAGIGNVNKWLEDNKINTKLSTTNVELPFEETTKYLRKVISNYDIYKEIYPNFS